MKKLLIILLLSLFSSLSLADGHMQANSFAVTLKVPQEDAARVEALLQSHHQFMHDDH